MKFINSIAILLILNLHLHAQPMLTLEEAIKIGIENSYKLHISNNDYSILKNKTNKYYAGYYPTIDVNASEDINITNTKQKFTTGTEVDKKGVRSEIFNAGINLNYAIYDGGLRKQNLQYSNQQLVGQHLQNNVLSRDLGYEITKAYYTIIKEKLLFKGLQSIETLINERHNLSQIRYELGNANRQELIQSTLDQNNILSQKLELAYKIDLLKIDFNKLLNRDPKILFDVSDTIILDATKIYDELDAKMQNQNLEIGIQKNNLNLAQLEYDIKKTNAYPNLNFHTRYGFGNNKNTAGFSLLNRNVGLYSGLSLNWNLFNGFRNKTDLKNQTLVVESEAIGLNQIKYQLGNELYYHVKSYNNYIELIELEKENEKLAKENIALSFERLRLGNTTILELKEAESTYQNTLNKIINLRYNAKTQELEISKLLNSEK